MRTPKGPQITLDVTSDIISASRPRDSRHCMIAEALRTAYPAASKISVDLATIRFTDKKKGLTMNKAAKLELLHDALMDAALGQPIGE